MSSSPSDWMAPRGVWSGHGGGLLPGADREDKFVIGLDGAVASSGQRPSAPALTRGIGSMRIPPFPEARA